MLWGFNEKIEGMVQAGGEEGLNIEDRGGCGGINTFDPKLRVLPSAILRCDMKEYRPSRILESLLHVDLVVGSGILYSSCQAYFANLHHRPPLRL